MVNKVKTIALAGALAFVAAPAFAQDMNMNPLGLPLVPNSMGDLPLVGGGGLDLDPLHIFTPAPAPAAVVHVHHHYHHMMMHHHHHGPLHKFRKDLGF